MGDVLVRDACQMLNLAFEQFYQRSVQKRLNYPVIYKKDGRLCVNSEELHHLKTIKNLIEKFYIPLTLASLKIFGDKYTMTRFYKHGNFIFKVVKLYGKWYIRRDAFEKFYHKVCSKHQLVSLSRIKKIFFDLPDSKINLILTETGIAEKYIVVVNGRASRKFFNFYDVNEWCDRMRLKRLKGH